MQYPFPDCVKILALYDVYCQSYQIPTLNVHPMIRVKTSQDPLSGFGFIKYRNKNRQVLMSLFETEGSESTVSRLQALS